MTLTANDRKLKFWIYNPLRMIFMKISMDPHDPTFSAYFRFLAALALKKK